MNPVRRLFADLVEKRLWPVALILVVAAFTVPVIVGSGGSEAGSDVPDPAVALPSTSAVVAPAVELTGPPAVRTRSGAVRDPFRRTKTAESSETEKTAKVPGENRSSSKSDSTTPGPTKETKKKTTSRPTTTTAIDPAIAKVARSSYQTVVRFTRAGGTRERPLARLAVLGNAADPALQYLGVSSGGEYAIFLLGPKATAGGDEGACVVADPCRAIGLREGDKLTVDVAAENQPVRRYELEVVTLRALHLSSEARASAWRARVDPVGFSVRRAIALDPVTASVLRKLHYVKRSGTVELSTTP